MLAQKPNLGRVLSDSWRITSSNSLHFLALSALFIFPISLFNIIHAFAWSSQPTPVHSHYGRLLSMQDSDVPPLDKSQIISLLLSSLPLLLFNLCSLPSITNSIFHGFHNKPLKLSSSLKSIISSFFPLLATKIAYVVIMAAVIFGCSFVMGFFFLGLALLGFVIEPNSTYFMVVVLVITAVFFVVFVYLGVEWFLMDASVVVESKWGFAAFWRSSSLVKGARGVALLIILLFWVLQMILWVWYSSLASRSKGGGCGVVVEMGVFAAASTLLSLFSLAVNTVFFVYCKAFNGELELPTTDKLGQVYIQLPHDVEDV